MHALQPGMSAEIIWTFIQFLNFIAIFWRKIDKTLTWLMTSVTFIMLAVLYDFTNSTIY